MIRLKEKTSTQLSFASVLPIQDLNLTVLSPDYFRCVYVLRVFVYMCLCVTVIVCFLLLLPSLFYSLPLPPSLFYSLALPPISLLLPSSTSLSHLLSLLLLGTLPREPAQSSC